MLGNSDLVVQSNHTDLIVLETTARQNDKKYKRMTESSLALFVPSLPEEGNKALPARPPRPAAYRAFRVRRSICCPFGTDTRRFGKITDARFRGYRLSRGSREDRAETPRPTGGGGNSTEFEYLFARYLAIYRVKAHPHHLPPPPSERVGCGAGSHWPFCFARLPRLPHFGRQLLALLAAACILPAYCILRPACSENEYSMTSAVVVVGFPAVAPSLPAPISPRLLRSASTPVH